MKTVLSLCLIWFGLLACTAEAAVIRLREQARVSSAVIRLGDIAEITHAGPEREAQLQSLTIGPAPAAGRSTKISVDAVRRELALRGIDQTELQFIGTSESLVQRPAIQEPVAETPVRKTSVNTAHWERDLLQQVSQLCQQQLPAGQRPLLQLDRGQLQQLQTQHASVSRWQVQTDRLTGEGPQQLTLQGVTTEGLPVAANLICHFTTRPRVLGLRQGLPRGQIIRPNDLMWLEQDDATDYLTSPEQVIGMETTRSVRAETPLRSEDLRQMPLIKRNEVVAVTVQIGSIQVRRYCRSLEEGSFGQYITLVPVDGKDKVTARVAGLREAQIVLESKPQPNAGEPQRQAIELGRNSPSQPAGPSAASGQIRAHSQAASSNQIIPSNQLIPSGQPLPGQLNSSMSPIQPVQHEQLSRPASTLPSASSPSGQIYSNRPAQLPE